MVQGTKMHCLLIYCQSGNGVDALQERLGSFNDHKNEHSLMQRTPPCRRHQLNSVNLNQSISHCDKGKGWRWRSAPLLNTLNDRRLTRCGVSSELYSHILSLRSWQRCL